MHDAFSNMKNLKEFIFMLCCLRAQSHGCQVGSTIKDPVIHWEALIRNQYLASLEEAQPSTLPLLSALCYIYYKHHTPDLGIN